MNRFFYKPLMVLSLIHLFLMDPVPVFAGISVSLDIDRKEATLADSVRMVVSVSGVRNSDTRPTVAGLETFHVSTGGTSSRVQIINGKMDASVEFTYFIQPRKTGTFQLGPATFQMDGKVFESNTATLKVNQQNGSAGMDRGPLFLQAQLSSPKAYAEEQITYTLKLYRQVKVSNVSLSLPQAEDLVFKQLGDPTEYQSVVQGNTYHVLEVRYAVIPSGTGKHSINPASMAMTVHQHRERTRRGIFDDPFFSFSRGRPTTLNSDALELEVLPLPDIGRPRDFSGLVGRFQIDAGLVPSEIKAGESATLTVHVTGRGNVNRIPDLNIPELTHTKVYADQPVLEVSSDSEGLTGSKTMKWALVPAKAGRVQIPSLSLSFFDTENHRYEQVKTSPFFLSVLPGEEKPMESTFQAMGNRATANHGKKEVTALGQDILPVHSSITDFTSSHHKPLQGVVLWILLILPCLVYTLALLQMRLKKRSARTVVAT